MPLRKSKSTLPRLLKAKELKSFLNTHPKWSSNAAGDLLKREVKISNYIDGLTILARVVVHAELLQHHPDVLLSYGKITFKISTHDVKGLTELDTDLAERIENILKP